MNFWNNGFWKNDLPQSRCDVQQFFLLHFIFDSQLVEVNIYWTKSKAKFSSINVLFDSIFRSNLGRISQTKSESNIATFSTRQTTFLRFQLSNKVQSNVAPAPLLFGICIVGTFSRNLYCRIFRSQLSVGFFGRNLNCRNFRSELSVGIHIFGTFSLILYCRNFYWRNFRSDFVLSELFVGTFSQNSYFRNF
jgi:hypothetical protein